jgi:AcrR family transcriptional regulator
VKPGRRPGDPDVTRQAILEAARDRFGEVGFERSTIRSIATAAGVDPALVHHHFGSKQALFAAAHELPMDPSETITAIASLPSEDRGEAIARLYLTLMGAADSSALSLIRAAATHDGASRMLREFIEDVLLSQADTLVDRDDARLRLALIGSHMMGLAFARSILQVPDLVAADTERLVTALAPTVTRYLTDPGLFDLSQPAD